jgi:hypothetical protein
MFHKMKLGVITLAPRKSGEAHGTSRTPATVNDRWAHRRGDEAGCVRNKSKSKTVGVGFGRGATTHPVSLTNRAGATRGAVYIRARARSRGGGEAEQRREVGERGALEAKQQWGSPAGRPPCRWTSSGSPSAARSESDDEHLVAFLLPFQMGILLLFQIFDFGGGPAFSIVSGRSPPPPSKF